MQSKESGGQKEMESWFGAGRVIGAERGNQSCKVNVINRYILDGNMPRIDMDRLINILGCDEKLIYFRANQSRKNNYQRE